MMGFDGPAQIHLDVDQFASDAETLPIAKIVAAHAERRRAEYRLTEKKIKLGLLGSEGYWSDSVPWYEWMTEPQVLQPCAEECGLKIEELAAVIAYQIVPMNWQVYSFRFSRSVAKSGLSRANRGYRRGYKITFSKVKHSIHAGYRPSLERFHRPFT